MFRNYLKTSIRFLWKNKTFSLINIIGLTAGTIACLYILLYVKDQYSYDRHHKNAEDIYRITSLLKQKGDKTSLMATCSPPIAPAMKNDFSEVAQYTRVVGTIGISRHLLKYKDRMFYETNALFVDSTFFNVFSYHFVNGSPQSAIQEPYSVVLDRSTSEKLFGNINPVGEFVEIDNSYGKHPFKITGVVDQAYGKSHIDGKMFISMNSGGIGNYVRENDSWVGNNFTSSYVKLIPLASAAALESKLPAFLQKYGGEQLKGSGREKQLLLQPLKSIHTSSGYEAETDHTISPTFMNLLLLIAGLIQLIACINFMNLSTARASKRAKEVGVRKVAGAGKSTLVWQFMSESLMISFFAILLAIPLLWVLLPALNKLSGTVIAFGFLNSADIWAMMISLVLLTVLLAGSYPALYLSAFNAIKVIKGNFTSNFSVTGIRRALVVFQFVLAIVLIFSILVIRNQMDYIKNKDLGFATDQRMVITFRTDEAKKQMDPFRNEIDQMSEVKSTSKSNNYPSQFVFNDMSLYNQDESPELAKNVQFMIVDDHFTETAGIQILAGRPFMSADSGRVLINETMMHAFGLNKSNISGKKLFYRNNENKQVGSLEIAGVMNDFNYSSLHEKVRPMLLMFSNQQDDLSHLMIEVNSKNYGSFISKMNGAWQKYLSFLPFEYNFLDDQVQKQYESENNLSGVINSFAIVAILISCLGLFGLSAFTAEQRTKEIGVRKVLGAGAGRIVVLLSGDFLKLVLIASFIAFPIAWWAMNKWLEGFAYRSGIAWWIFLAAGLIAIAVAMLTVSFQAIRSAIANPIKSLRNE